MKPYRQKFARIAELPDVTVRVITPTRWYESFQDIAFELSADTACEEFACPIRFSGYGSRFYYRDGLKPHFRDFQPDIIHLEEEAWSVNALQTLYFRRRYCPRSRFIFRTSLSIPAKQRFGYLPVWIERRVFRAADVAFPLSENAGAILRQRGYTGKLIPFPNGVDLRLFHKVDAPDLKAQLGLKRGLVIGYVGRLLYMKGLDTLLKAASQLEVDHQLLIVGSGEYKPALVKLAQQLNISEHIVWVDAVPPEAVPAYLNCMDCLVLPSRTTPDWVEFFGRVFVEAMACEVPVVGSNAGEIPNVIGDAGRIFPEGDAKALANRLHEVVTDPALRAQLIQRGLARVKQFSWETIAQRTYEVYRDLRP